MVSKEEFNMHVKDLLGDDVSNNKYLKQEYINSCKFLTIFGVIICFVAILLFLFIKTAAFVLFLIGIIITIIGSVRSSKTTMAEIEISKKYKGKLISYLLSDYKHEYDYKRYIDKEMFNRGKFIRIKKNYDCYKGEDLISINIPNNDSTPSDCYLTLSDVYAHEIEHYTDSEGNHKSRTNILYNGMFGYIKFPFEFNCTLTVNNMFYTKKGLKRVELESIEFNRKFLICSTDQVEARYILTPVMMEKFLEINKKINSFTLVLDGDMMYIGGPYKKLFEISGIKSGQSYEAFSKVYDDMKLIIEFVEEIKNNDKVFKM